MAINPINSETIDAIKRKTAYMLPDNPSAQGMKAADIKKAFYQSQTDTTLSIIASINTLIAEANHDISQATQSVDIHEARKDNPHLVSKSQVGLGNVDNTADMDKPISTASQNAINTVSQTLSVHKVNTSNPHNVTKSQVGLGNVDNTADLNKPVSTAQQTAINARVAKADIADNLTTDDATKVLSAKQGKKIKDTLDGLPNAYATTISVSYASSTGVITVKLKDENGNTLSTDTVDLPLELLLAPSGSYYSNGVIYLKLANNEYIEIDVSDLLVTYTGDGSSINVVGGVISVATELKQKITAAYNAVHSHSNLALLETYLQTEEDLADAVSKKHGHSNLATLQNTTAAFTHALEVDIQTLKRDALPHTQLITISPSDWHNKLAVKGATYVTANNIIIATPEPAYYNDYLAAGIRLKLQASGAVTFECDETPSTTVKVQIATWGGE